MVTKIPRFAFEKFPQADRRLTTQMKSVGEVMAMGRTFQESFQKALRGLEVGVDGMNEKTTGPRSAREGTGRARPGAHLVRGRRLRHGLDAWTRCYELTKIDQWFLVQIEEIVEDRTRAGNA